MPAGAFRLLRAIAARNDRDWMREHRDPVRDELRAPFAAILEAASWRLAEAGVPLAGGEDTLFRMARDLRFTSDKRPFHEHVEGMLAPGRRKIGNRAAIHVRCDREGGFLRAGSFLQPLAALRAVREAMVAREDRFEDLAARLEEAGCPLTSAVSQRRLPRGFEAAADGALAPFLRMKAPLAERSLRPGAWRDGTVVDEIVAFALAARPWLLFLGEALDGLSLPVHRAPRSPGRPRGGAPRER